MPRRKGSVNKNGYKVSPLVMARAAATAMQRFGKSTILERMSNCEHCPVSNGCTYSKQVMLDKENVNLPESEKIKCPLYNTYKESILNTLRSPVMELAKDIATIEVKLQQQIIRDGYEKETLSPTFIKGMELKLKAAKVYNETKKLMIDTKRTQTSMGTARMINDEDVLDATFKDVTESDIESATEESSQEDDEIPYKDYAHIDEDSSTLHQEHTKKEDNAIVTDEFATDVADDISIDKTSDQPQTEVTNNEMHKM